MRLSKSLLAIAAASTLAAAAAFAEDSRPTEAMEGEAPILLSEEPSLLNEEWGYYLIVPESEDEMQTNG